MRLAAGELALAGPTGIFPRQVEGFVASAGFIATLGLRLGRLAFDAAGVNRAAFFALFKPRKSINEVPPHGLAERSKDTPELCPDNSGGYVHLAQQLGPLYVPLVSSQRRNLAG